MSKNKCFEAATPIIYRETVCEGEESKMSENIIIESISDAFEKHSDDEIYVCVHVFDETDHISKVVWKRAKLCKTQSIQQVVIYLITNEFIGDGLESENVIRVTPNHVFPVLTKHGYKDVDAYLLQTGDKLIFERTRKDISIEVEERIANGLEDGNSVILSDGSLHYLDYRHIAKVSAEDLEESTDFYGICVVDETSESKYIMTCNSCISHDSSVD